MDYASSESALIGLATSAAISLVIIVACILFLKERSAGPWAMLVGAIATLVGRAAPQTIYMIVNSKGVDSISPGVEQLMYDSVWSWVGLIGGILFAVGLLLTAIRRRGLDARVRELETVLQAKDR